MKKIYKARSTLAHGQAWELNDERVTEVEKAARVLTRTLGLMLLKQRSELDLMELDLS